jgi:hypothetical protein
VARDVARASLYTAPINLWVEDELTRAYLDAVWNSPAVKFLIGGGNEGLQAIVNDAERAGRGVPVGARRAPYERACQAPRAPFQSGWIPSRRP